MTSRLPFIVSRTDLHIMCDLFVTILRCFHVVSVCTCVFLCTVQAPCILLCSHGVVMLYSAVQLFSRCACIPRVYQSSRVSCLTQDCVRTYAVGSVVSSLLFYAMRNWLTNAMFKSPVLFDNFGPFEFCFRLHSLFSAHLFYFCSFLSSSRFYFHVFILILFVSAALFLFWCIVIIFLAILTEA